MLSRYALHKRCPYKPSGPAVPESSRNCEGPNCMAWEWTGGKADPLDGDCALIRRPATSVPVPVAREARNARR